MKQDPPSQTEITTHTEQPQDAFQRLEEPRKASRNVNAVRKRSAHRAKQSAKQSAKCKQTANRKQTAKRKQTANCKQTAKRKQTANRKTQAKAHRAKLLGGKRIPEVRNPGGKISERNHAGTSFGKPFRTGGNCIHVKLQQNILASSYKRPTSDMAFPVADDEGFGQSQIPLHSVPPIKSANYLCFKLSSKQCLNCNIILVFFLF